MKIILTLTVSGSLVLLFIMVFQPYIKLHGLFRWQDYLVKMSIGSYLVPLPFVKILYHEIRKELWGMGPGEIYGESDGSIQVFYDRVSALKTDNRVLLSAAFRIYLIITGIALLIAMSFFVRELYRYWKLKYMFSSSMLIKEYQDVPALVGELSEKLHIKNVPEVYEDIYGIGALTTGVIHPIIVVPAKLQGDKLETALLHELCHIKRKDMLVKFLVTIAVCIHWYNPLVYFLPNAFTRTCELCCDNMVVQNISKNKRAVYAHEIVEMAAGNRVSIPSGYMGFSKKSFTEERVMNIMKEKKRTKGGKSITALLSICLLFTTVLPAYAYEIPPVIHISGDTKIEESEMDGFKHMDIQFTVENKPAEFETIMYEKQFVDGNGNIYNAAQETRFNCDHSEMVSGIYQIHTKNSDGSCNTKNYQADRCLKCGTVFKGDYISELSYAHCPH